MMVKHVKAAGAAAAAQAWRELRIMAICAPLLALAVLIFPRAETELFPVVTEATVISAEDAGGGWTRLEVEAEKLRDCDWRGVSWHFGTRGWRSVAVRAYFEDPPQIRAPGLLHWSGLMVELPRDQVMRASFGDVTHECLGGAFGLTRSRFFTGGEK